MTLEQNESSSINVRRGRVDSLDIYEITKDELEVLKQGSPNSIFLNFSIALFSIFISILSTLLTVSISSDRIFFVFVVVLVVTFIAGIITCALWARGENSFKKMIVKIEDRIQGGEYKISNDSIEAVEEK